MVTGQASSAEMQALAQEFVQFAVDSGVLRFGEFKTKAGRLSPYFFNAGLFDDGAKMLRLAEFYAERLIGSGREFAATLRLSMQIRALPDPIHRLTIFECDHTMRSRMKIEGEGCRALFGGERQAFGPLGRPKVLVREERNVVRHRSHSRHGAHRHGCRSCHRHQRPPGATRP